MWHSANPATRRGPALWAIVALALGTSSTVAGAGVEAITLTLEPDIAAVDSTVTFSGSVTPAGVVRVEIYRQEGADWHLVVAGDSNVDGSYRLRAVVRVPGDVVARAAGEESAPAALRIKPVLTARFDGLPVLGAPLFVTGRLRPGTGGVVTLTIRGRSRDLALDANGRFRARVSTGRAGGLEVRLGLRPAPGYAPVARRLSRRVETPALRLGSSGAAVRFLERRLDDLRYAILGADRTYRSDTRDAVYAFQKVEGLPRDGVVGRRFWLRLLHARTPTAAVRHGSHIEVDKRRQVLFEVRRGKVARVVHVSTGATGNTPVGRWRVYRKTPGFNSLAMYYTLYFHRGFAIHGYASVPSSPASHGCVRVPLWYARHLYSNWTLGNAVLVR